MSASSPSRSVAPVFYTLTLLAGVIGFPDAPSAQTVSREQVVAALPRLEALAEDAVRADRVPGLAIAVVHDDKIIYLKGFGRREAGKPEGVDADTVFQIASLSKPVSSAVVASLVSAGVVSWDSRIADLDPSFRLLEPYPTSQLTIRDLFAHRSGLPGTAGDDLEDIGYDRSEILRRMRFVPPSSSFRAGYSYSNVGLTEGAVAAARPTGRSWEEVAEERLYRPLGMASTSSRYKDFLTHPNRVSLHVWLNHAWTARVRRNPDTQAPAGGISSNVRDLAQWMRLELTDGVLDGKRIIAAAAFDQPRRPQMPLGTHPGHGGSGLLRAWLECRVRPPRTSLGPCRRVQRRRADGRRALSEGEARHRRADQRLSIGRSRRPRRQFRGPCLRRKARAGTG